MSAFRMPRKLTDEKELSLFALEQKIRMEKCKRVTSIIAQGERRKAEACRDVGVSVSVYNGFLRSKASKT